LEAARDRTFTKQMAEKVRLMAQGFPEADADVLAMRGEDPPERIGVVDRGQNKVLEPLHDERGRGRRLLEGDALNLRDATRMMGDFRDAQARYQAELLAQLQQTEPEQAAPEPAAPEPQAPAPEMVAQQEALARQQQALAQQAAVVAAQRASVG